MKPPGLLVMAVLPVAAWCACGPLKERLTLQLTRISQADIDRGKYGASELFDMGGFLFRHEFTVSEGLGNNLRGGPAGDQRRPNSRRLHHGKFGGPDGRQCLECHTVGGPNGGGTLEDNLLQDGDGIHDETALVRNPPALLGVGYLQALGAEMTQELRSQKATPDRTPNPLCANNPGALRRVPLMSKGVQFGTYSVACNGATDFSGSAGVDVNLEVKPLGRKGRTATLRRFVEGGFQVHFGMAAETLIHKHCDSPIFDVVGDGRRCVDPDNDGIEDEITEGQLTAMAVWSILLPVPTQKWPGDEAALRNAQEGEHLFETVGCTSCHRPALTLNSPVVVEVPDLTHGSGVHLDLTVDGKAPRLHANADGSVTVPLFSDLRRHDMGESLADPHDTFGVFPARQFLTTPLWGVAVTPPYLHDGRAATLQQAIELHGGEADAARRAWNQLNEEQQNSLIAFLSTLSREPGEDPAYGLPFPF